MNPNARKGGKKAPSKKNSNPSSPGRTSRKAKKRKKSTRTPSKKAKTSKTKPRSSKNKGASKADKANAKAKSKPKSTIRQFFARKAGASSASGLSVATSPKEANSTTALDSGAPNPQFASETKSPLVCDPKIGVQKTVLGELSLRKSVRVEPLRKSVRVEP